MKSFHHASRRIHAERLNQHKKWAGTLGDCCHPRTPLEHKMTILMEEVGELAKAILEEKPLEIYLEAVQTAAVAHAIVESLVQEETVL